MDYHRYLQSHQWKARAQAARKRAGYRCQVCNSPTDIAVHHRTYERLGHEKPEDLTVLCQDCHALFHDKQHRGGWFLPFLPSVEQTRALVESITKRILHG